MALLSKALASRAVTKFFEWKGALPSIMMSTYVILVAGSICYNEYSSRKKHARILDSFNMILNKINSFEDFVLDFSNRLDEFSWRIENRIDRLQDAVSMLQNSTDTFNRSCEPARREILVYYFTYATLLGNHEDSDLLDTFKEISLPTAKICSAQFREEQ